MDRDNGYEERPQIASDGIHVDGNNLDAACDRCERGD